MIFSKEVFLRFWLGSNFKTGLLISEESNHSFAVAYVVRGTDSALWAGQARPPRESYLDCGSRFSNMPFPLHAKY